MNGKDSALASAAPSVVFPLPDTPYRISYRPINCKILYLSQVSKERETSDR